MDGFKTPDQALQGTAGSTPPPTAGNVPINDILRVATKIRNEYGARDGRINNANNPQGNFRAWSSALQLAQQLVQQKGGLLAGPGNKLTVGQVQQAQQASQPGQPTNLLQEEGAILPRIVEQTPEAGIFDPVYAQPTGGTGNKQFGIESTFSDPQVQNPNVDVGKTFATPRITEEFMSMFGNW